MDDIGRSSQLFATTWHEHINNNIELHSHKQSLQSEFKVFQHLKTNKRHFSKSIESQWFHIFSKKNLNSKKSKWFTSKTWHLPTVKKPSWDRIPAQLPAHCSRANRCWTAGTNRPNWTRTSTLCWRHCNITSWNTKKQ